MGKPEQITCKQAFDYQMWETTSISLPNVDPRGPGTRRCWDCPRRSAPSPPGCPAVRLFGHCSAEGSVPQVPPADAGCRSRLSPERLTSRCRSSEVPTAPSLLVELAGRLTAPRGRLLTLLGLVKDVAEVRDEQPEASRGTRYGQVAGVGVSVPVELGRVALSVRACASQCGHPLHPILGLLMEASR